MHIVPLDPICAAGNVAAVAAIIAIGWCGLMGRLTRPLLHIAVSILANVIWTHGWRLLTTQPIHGFSFASVVVTVALFVFFRYRLNRKRVPCG